MGLQEKDKKIAFSFISLLSEGILTMSSFLHHKFTKNLRNTVNINTLRHRYRVQVSLSLLPLTLDFTVFRGIFLSKFIENFTTVLCVLQHLFVNFFPKNCTLIFRKSCESSKLSTPIIRWILLSFFLILSGFFPLIYGKFA